MAGIGHQGSQGKAYVSPVDANEGFDPGTIKSTPMKGSSGAQEHATRGPATPANPRRPR